MSTGRPLRFGCVARGPFTTRADWAERVRRVDGLGFDTLLVADHLGMWSPFPALVAAAAASERLRFGIQVLNIELWNPALLARDIATADALTDGRLEVGFGAGHAEVEFLAAGLRYPRAGERVDHLAELVPLVRRLLAGEEVTNDGHYALVRSAVGLAATQARIPFMVGGNGDRVLAIGGRDADIVGLVGFTSGSGQVHVDLSHFDWAGLADRVAHVRASAARDDLELSVLVQSVTVTDDRAQTASNLAQLFEQPIERILDSPFVLVGSAAEIADQLRRLRDDHGVTYVTTFEPSAPALAEAIALLR